MPKPELSSTVSFRLDRKRADRLQTLADRQGVSLHEKARQMLIAALDDGQAQADLVQLELAEVRGAVEKTFERVAQMEAGTKESFVALFRGLQLAKTDEQARELIELVFSQSLRAVANTTRPHH
jgi:hypothetical protein